MSLFSSLSGLLVKSVSVAGSKTVKNLLTSAGVGLVTSKVVLVLVTGLINQAVAQFGLLSVVGLLGLSGVDIGLSIIVGALTARATMASQALSFKSLK